uniref:Uncharacterized protein n=1 Tax=Aegilops tauschii subsp. strangulata TaxID=200361 RepID=A0A453BNM0_AEGTS
MCLLLISCCRATHFKLRRMLPMWRMCLAGALGAENVYTILILKWIKAAAEDEIHANITCTDIDSNNPVQIDDLASSLAQLHLGPCYPSIAVYQPRRRPRSRTRRQTSRRRRSPCGRTSESSCRGSCW